MASAQPALHSAPPELHQGKYIRRFFAGFIFAFGCLVLLGTVLSAKVAHERREWKPTTGVVKAVNAYSATKVEYDRQRQIRKQTTEWTTVVSVEYQVDSRTYRSTEQLFGDLTTAFPVGSSQTVYYDPNNVADMTLFRPDVGPVMQYGSIIGGAFLLAGVLLWRYPRS